MNWKTSLALWTCLWTFSTIFAADASLPDLAQLKVAAESGDRIAQYDYARRLSGISQDEKFDWYMKSAKQGYAPAQDSVAEMLSSRYYPDPKKKKLADRQSLRWASRAAYQGLPSAQGRVSQAYAQGTGVPADPLKAYTWAQIAVISSGGDQGKISGMIYKANRDVLIPKTPSQVIVEGQRLAAAFRPTRYGQMSPIEADLVFGELNLSAIYEIKDHKSAVVNGVRFTAGETKPIEVDQNLVTLTCVSIEGKMARFAIAGTDYQADLTLRR